MALLFVTLLHFLWIILISQLGTQNTYTYKDYILDTDVLVKDVPNGDYLITAVLKNNEKAVSGIELDVTVSN